MGRPTWLWANGVTGMAYQGYYPHGGIAGRSLANGANSQWGYDAVQRLSAVIHNPAGTAQDATWTFGFNPASQIGSVTRNNDAYAWTRHYAVVRTYTTNGLNQYSATASTTGSGPVSTAYTYDRNGNLVATDNPFDGLREYAYDVENRLVERSGGVVLTYDPLGRLFRVASTAGATPTTTTFLYDGDARVAEYNSAGEVARRYVHNVGADVPLLSYQGAALNLPSYLHADHQGSIVAVSDPWGAGSVNTYDEYGIPGAGNMGRFQYTGQIWLPELGMYHYKARVYSPTLGRFLQTDPVGYEGRINLYAYVGNDPANAVDVDGTNPLVICALNPWCRGFFVGVVRWGLRQLVPQAPRPAFTIPIPTVRLPVAPRAPPASHQENDAAGEEGNTNPYRGPVDEAVIVSDAVGNGIPVGAGEQLTGSPDGEYHQVRDRERRETGVRMDRGGHRNRRDPNARGPHAHRPGHTTPEGNPHLPIRPRSSSN